MRILYHHRTLGDGAEGIHIREMVRAFRDLGHEVKVIGPAGETPPGQSARFGRLQAVKRAVPGVAYELLEIGYTAHAYISARREIAAFRPDFIYDRYITFNAGLILAGRHAGVPVCLEVNAPLALERSGEQDEKLIFRKTAARMERWICANATWTIVVSTPLKEYLGSIGVPDERCVVMPNGVDPEKFSPRPRQVQLARQLGLTDASFVVGFTGVLRPWHGLDLLVGAVARLRRNDVPAVLLIVGDGPYRTELEKIVAERNMQDAVFITGRMAHNQVPDYVSLFDAAVSPRATFYASPMKVLEYMSLGKAVVVPGTQNFLDIIDEGVNGVSFRDGDEEDLCRALAYVHGMEARRVDLGSQARRKVEERLNWRWNAREVCRLVEHQQ